MQQKTRIDGRRTSARFREKLEVLGWTQEQLAQGVGVGQPQISRLLAGKFSRPSATVQRICEKLDTNCIEVGEGISFDQFPELKQCLAGLLDGTRRREKAIVRLLKSARDFR